MALHKCMQNITLAQIHAYTNRMNSKFILVATAIALIRLSLTCTTLAAPLQQWKSTSDLKNELFKSFISQALIQQEDSDSVKDKEMAADFCKLIIQMFNILSPEVLKSFGNDVEDKCYQQNLKLPPEPRPEDKSAFLDNLYRSLFKRLKNTGIDKHFEDFVNRMKNLVGG